jgi:hypothetical protein
MKKYLVTLALAWGLIPAALALAAPAMSAHAVYNPVGKACSGNNQSAACNSQSTTNVVGKNGIIARVTRIVAAVGALVAVIVIIIYGFQMITSYGDSGKATAARNAIVGAVVGLVVIALAQAIVVFIVSNL